MTGRHLFLVGYRGSGKSSVGRILAERMNRPFVDTDHWVELHSQRSIKELFEKEGEEAFRDWESLAIGSVCVPGSVSSIISLGGGAILRPGNRAMLKQHGQTVWLTAPATTLASRISRDEANRIRRPSLTGLGELDEVEKVLALREPLYREAADWTLNTEALELDEIADQIARWASLHP
jgi:shikimate kinase